jgi:di/tricarboxylate transporter
MTLVSPQVRQQSKVHPSFRLYLLTNYSRYIFSVMFSPTIMLLIGGFTIASALSKTNIDRVLITKVLSFAGTRPSTVLLSFMGVSCFASMWISNVAAPTLCFTLIRVSISMYGMASSLSFSLQPILRTLPPKSSFGPCLIVSNSTAHSLPHSSRYSACNCSCRKYWRAKLTDIISAKSNRPTTYGPSP